MKVTPEYVYAKIQEYEGHAGESLLDQYDGTIDVVPFMKTMLEVGRISEEQYELWRTEYNNQELDARMVMTVLSNEDGFEKPYAVTQFTEEELDLEDYTDYESKIYVRHMRPICEYLALERSKDLWNMLESEMQETIDYYER